MVAFAGLIQAFLHHTSYDAEVAPFLPAGRLLEIVEDSHGQGLQECQVVEFVKSFWQDVVDWQVHLFQARLGYCLVA